MLTFSQLDKLVTKDYKKYIPSPTHTIPNVCYGMGFNECNAKLKELVNTYKHAYMSDCTPALRKIYLEHEELLLASEIGSHTFWKLSGVLMYLETVRSLGKISDAEFAVPSASFEYLSTNQE